MPDNKILEQSKRKKSKKCTNGSPKVKNEESEAKVEKNQTNNPGLLLPFNKIKKENVKNLLQSKEILNKSHKNESLEHAVKRKSKKDSKESSRKKKKSFTVSSCITSSVQENREKNIQVKLEKKSVKNQTNNPKSLLEVTKRIITTIDANHTPNQLKTFEKDANESSKNDKIKIAGKTNLMSKLL